MDVIFVHFRVDAGRLQRRIPLELDRFDDQAYVSLVAFTQQNLSLATGAKVARWLAAPVAHHEFLNVRTYVRRGQVRGIYFMTEWIPNRLAAWIGPRMYGLPYRLGGLRYGTRRREVISGSKRLLIETKRSPGAVKHASPMALDGFLLERYTAFTHRHGVTRRFDVEHAPWLQSSLDVKIKETSLLGESGDWFEDAEFARANYSPGVTGVRIGGPIQLAPIDASLCATIDQ
jgi:uncharacterized protein YqjF (DUF2071 family)